MAGQPDVDVHHPHLTTAGLLVESFHGLSERLERELVSDGLSVQWFDVLIRLLRTPEHRLRMSDLAAQSTLSPSGLTRAVDRLEAAGLVVREACPSDRRGANAVLTATGEARIAAALPTHLEQLAEVFDDAYTDEELQQLTELLRKLRDRVNPDAAAASAPRLPCDIAGGC